MKSSRTAGKPRVIYRLDQPTPYFVERFNTIARRGNIDLEAWFDAERWADRSWDVVPADWEFPARYITPSRFGPAKLIRAQAPDVYLSPYWNVSFNAALWAAKSAGSKTVLRVLKTFDTWLKRHKRHEAAKHVIFRTVDAVQTSGPDGTDYAQRYGARRVYAFHEPIDVSRFARGSALGRGNAADREKLGLSGCVYLYVGRLWRSKGLDYLIEAFGRLRQDGIAASLLLVGDGVDEGHLRAVAAETSGVAFVGYVQQSDLPYYYGLADAFVFPTLGDPYGHVVHEAMASSVPVISTENAGDIRERIIEGESGFIVPAADSEALYSRMRMLAVDDELRERMAARGLSIVQSRDLGWWASEFEGMIYDLANIQSSESVGVAA